jgi:hypothetical protein
MWVSAYEHNCVVVKGIFGKIILLANKCTVAIETKYFFEEILKKNISRIFERNT